MPESEFQVARGAKRRRRELATVALTTEDNQSQKQTLQPQEQEVDKNSSANTTKRSSRFRGVSRS